jgi:hypothetical protein
MALFTGLTEPSRPPVRRRQRGARTVFSLLAALALIDLHGGTAMAEPPPSHSSTASAQVAVVPPSEGTTEIVWYGYQPFLADAAAAGFLLAGAATAFQCISIFESVRCDRGTSDGLIGASAGLYLAASPAIHAVHGHWDNAAYSLGIRAAPLVLGLTLMAPGSRSSAQLGGYTILGGGLAAAMIDDAFLAREAVPRDTTAWYVAPVVDDKHHMRAIAVGGAF